MLVVGFVVDGKWFCGVSAMFPSRAIPAANPRDPPKGSWKLPPPKMIFWNPPV